MSIQSEITRLQGIKSNIRTALANKEVSGAANMDMEDFADAINGIESGGSGGGSYITISQTQPTSADGSDGDLWVVMEATE